MPNSALLTLAMACMPAGSAFLWAVWGARLLRGGAAGASGLFWALVLLPAAASMSIVVIQRRVGREGPRRILNFVVGFVGLIIAAAAVRLEWLAAWPAPAGEGLLFWQLSLVPIPLACLALWLWGVWVGHGSIGPRDVRLAVSRNVMSILLLYLFYNSAPVLEQNESLGPIVTVFVSGVMALAASNLERLRVQREGKGMAPVLDRYWLQTVVGLVALLLLTGVLITGLSGTHVLAQFGTVVLIALGAIAIGVSWLLVAFGVMIFILLYPLRALFESVSSRIAIPTPLPTPAELATAQAALPATPVPGASRVFEIAGWAVAVGLVAAIILMVFWLSLRSSELGRTESAEDVRESILSRELLLSQLRNLIGGRGARTAKALSAYLPLGGAPDAPRARIRRAYQRALQWAYERGRVRAPSETPHAFAGTLSALAPDTPAGRELTEAYVPARYGEAEPEARLADAAEDALSRLVQDHQARDSNADRT
jgi:Domain of unknown function (DUF4129)